MYNEFKVLVLVLNINKQYLGGGGVNWCSTGNIAQKNILCHCIEGLGVDAFRYLE